MRVIAHKKESILWRYILVIIIGFLVIFGVVSSYFDKELDFSFIVISVLIIIFDLYQMIKYLKTPKNIIYYDEENEFILLNNKKDKVYLKKIDDVSYRKARRKSHYYNWGILYITANGRKFVLYFVDECEFVCKYILEKSTIIKNKL